MNIFKWIRRQDYKIFYYDSLFHSSIHGKFRVLYPDGKRSQKFCWRIANNYKEIFGGTVIDAF